MDQMMNNMKRDSVRAYLVGQVVMADEFYRFCHAAHSRGFDAEFMVRVDNQICKTAVNMTSGTARELFEYLCSWAAGERLKAEERLSCFENGVPVDIPTGSRGDGGRGGDSDEGDRGNFPFGEDKTGSW